MLVGGMVEYSIAAMVVGWVIWGYGNPSMYGYVVEYHPTL